ncbi:hypothetical protein [Desulfosporosinus sp.]|uniref:hypothetical protein n=1 Tax=Desulfosporosinus sp. TaxID=157907 RepID=UPI0025BEB6A9|nr:hypothetical protein [Desulfosporosinus sp.]MBC2724511.1 hypothetical protein [Desulfosporosinus sp.]MBC2727381.1 hypothetical protein [Desulfosporosinus sp.]
MNEQVNQPKENKLNFNKNFLIIDDCTDDEFYSMMEKKVKLFAVQLFGKDILDKIEVEVTLTEDDDLEEHLSICMIFKELKYYSVLRGKELQSINLILENNGYQAFYDKRTGNYFSKLVYQFKTGWGFQNDLENAYDLPTWDIYNKYNDFILTC